MSYEQIIGLLTTLTVVLTCLLALSIAVALIALIELRRVQSIMARRDPLFEGITDARPPGLVERLRRRGLL